MKLKVFKVLKFVKYPMRFPFNFQLSRFAKPASPKRQRGEASARRATFNSRASRGGPPAGRQGFTLIELMVSVALFSIVISIAVGGFVRTIRTQRQIVSLLSANSNVSLVLEQMAREFRTGENFIVGAPGRLTFTNARGESVTYCLDAEAVNRSVNSPCGPGGQKITADNVAVSYLAFSALGHLPGDTYPPRVTVSLGVRAKEIGVDAVVVDLQTTVSARRLDS
jgi:prepilin-type N-terminal cleavage/methylation domain-containing protein